MKILLKPTKEKFNILFLENNYANLKIKKQIKVKYIDRNAIYIYFLINSFLTYLKFFFKYSFKAVYLHHYCKFFKINLVIGDQFNLILLDLKKIDNRIKTILYFRYLMRKDQIDNYKLSLANKNKVDYIFVQNLFMKNSFLNIFEGEFVISGFIKNNEIKIKKSNISYDLMVISEFRKFEDEKFNYIKKNLKLLSNYCKKNKLKVCIALTSLREDKKKYNYYNAEKNYFQDLGFKVKNYKLESYSLAASSNVIYSMYSNLGYELLSRSFKVLFVSKKKEKFMEKYNFYANNMEDGSLKLKKLISLSKKNFLKKIKKNNNFIFDKKNNLLKKIIYKNI